MSGYSRDMKLHGQIDFEFLCCLFCVTYRGGMKKVSPFHSEAVTIIINKFTHHKVSFIIDLYFLILSETLYIGRLKFFAEVSEFLIHPFIQLVVVRRIAL